MLRTGEKATGMIERSQGNIYRETNFENSTWRSLQKQGLGMKEIKKEYAKFGDQETHT